MSLGCSANQLDIKYCVSKQSCQNAKPVEIYCEGESSQANFIAAMLCLQSANSPLRMYMLYK